MRKLASAALTLVVLANAASARAEPTPEEKALGTTLFREGRELLDQGRVNEACAKLDESQRLDPGGGTLLNLAVCHERAGRTASAWAEFTEALSAARRDRRADRVQLAEEKISALVVRLSTITIDVPKGAESLGLEVRRDGSPVRPPAWGVPMPVDPGPHQVSAVAPGKRAWTASLMVSDGGDALHVTLPRLDVDLDARGVSGPVPAPSSPAELPTGSLGQHRPETAGVWGANVRVAGIASAALGGAGLLAGAIFGTVAITTHDAANTYCTGKVCRDAQGVQLNSESAKEGNVATVAFSIGGVAAVTGAILYLVAPPAPKLSAVAVRIEPTIGSVNGVSIVGGW